MDASLLADDDALLAHAGIDRSLPERVGLFRDDGWLRRVSREPAVLFGGGCALLLEVAHPLVAAGVAEHSDFRRDPFGPVRRSPRRAGLRARTSACAAGFPKRSGRSRRGRATAAAIPISCCGCGRHSSTPRSRSIATSSACSMHPRSRNTTAISARSRCCSALPPTARPAIPPRFGAGSTRWSQATRLPSARPRARSRARCSTRRALRAVPSR
ncbi:MAG: DUF2236 domain-containing protein [Deltaproteobacteria bacterium]|nr:MAG: DUF2236 domain-containing protein [Deltaproteobacteria bacterium]